MNLDRRRLLRSLRSCLVASCASSLLPTWGGAARTPPPAALLLPLTGAHAALGRSMARAAALAQADDKKGLFVLDTGGTPAGAGAAAALALKRGAGMILGPVFSPEVRPVLAAVGGRVPVLALSNDATLLEQGAFLLGITADQLVNPLLAYARGRGVRRIAIAAGTSAWDAQVAAAARAAAQRIGLTIVGAAEAPPPPILPYDISAMGAGARARRAADRNAAAPDPGTGANPGTGPDAELVSGDVAALAAAARRLKDSGVQLLAVSAGLDADPVMLAALDGAWLCAPDPGVFANFASAYEAQNGSPPGIITGLAYDAAGIAVAVRRGGGTDRSALLTQQGFKGACGDLRFRDDGSAQRTMAILAVDAGRYRLVDHGAA